MGRIPSWARKGMAWVAACAAITAFGLLLVMYGVREHGRCYPMPPRDFWAQAEAIKLGMTTAEARSKVVGATREVAEQGRLVFELKPTRQPRFFAIPPICISFYINVDLDDNNRVVRVFTSDG